MRRNLKQGSANELIVILVRFTENGSTFNRLQWGKCTHAVRLDKISKQVNCIITDLIPFKWNEDAGAPNETKRIKEFFHEMIVARMQLWIVFNRTGLDETLVLP